MPVQFEEDQPFSSTGLPAEKPKGMVKFLMDEGFAKTPKTANIELIVIAIILVTLSLGLIVYKNILLNSTHDIQYDPTHDPMVNVVQNFNQ